MRAADDRRNASIMISSSIRCSSTGAHVGWTMKTSVPRMFSSIWNDTSVSGNRRSRACPSGMPRNSAISARQLRVRAAREDFQVAESRRHRHASLVHRPGALDDWLGRKDSNLRIRDPKSRALPLGHAPAPWRRPPHPARTGRPASAADPVERALHRVAETPVHTSDSAAGKRRGGLADDRRPRRAGQPGLRPRAAGRMAAAAAGRGPKRRRRPPIRCPTWPQPAPAPASRAGDAADRRVAPDHRRLEVVAQSRRPRASPAAAGRRRRGPRRPAGPRRTSRRPRRSTTPNGGLTSTTAAAAVPPAERHRRPGRGRAPCPPARKNGTSAPSRAARRLRRRQVQREPPEPVSASSVAAASALPPPSPACGGIRLLKPTRRRAARRAPPRARQSSAAACHTRLRPVERHAGRRRTRSRTGPRRGVKVSVSCSAIA